ncbi:MAG TPA: sugar ABC transporter substrate-binding protein [Oscillatoriaceae cyanobacterium]
MRSRRLVLLLSLLLAGCYAGDRDERAATHASPAPPPPGAPAINPALAQAHGTLTIWLAADYAQAPVFKQLDTAFERSYPGVHVKLLGVPWESMPTKVKTAIIGGDPPDVAHYHPFVLGAQGFAEPLDDLWAQWGQEKAFLPGAMADASWNGHRYGVPLDINCTILMYNRAILAAHHVAPPAAGYTLADWRRDLLKLTDPAKRTYGLGLSTGPWYTYAFIRANGGELVKLDHGHVEATFTDPRTVQAVQFLTALGTRDHVGPTPSTKAKDYQDAATLFTMGQVAMIYTGPWDFDTVHKDAPKLDFGVSRFPAGLDGVQRAGVQGGGGLFVPKGAHHRALAFEWMKWATSRPFAMRLAEEQGRFPVRKAFYDDPFFKRDKHIQTFVTALPGASPYRLEAYPQADQAFQDAVKACFYGADAATELAKAQKIAQLSIDATEAQ